MARTVAARRALRFGSIGELKRRRGLAGCSRRTALAPHAERFDRFTPGSELCLTAIGGLRESPGGSLQFIVRKLRCLFHPLPLLSRADGSGGSLAETHPCRPGGSNATFSCAHAGEVEAHDDPRGLTWSPVPTGKTDRPCRRHRDAPWWR